MQLNQRVVLVTGANGGIGASLCEKLSAAGATLVLASLQEAALLQMVATLGSHHVAVVADISEPNGRAAISDACQRAGGLDILINLAGVLDSNLFHRQSEATLDRLMQVNAVAPILLTHLLLPQLLHKPQARIVNVGSTFGSIGHPGFTAYCASKAAMKMFSEALARELADTGVSVGYIAPRATDTPLNSANVIALNRRLGNHMDSPAHVAHAIFTAVQNQQRLRYLGWPEAFFVRINAILPGVVHHVLVRKLSLIKQILG
jgi:short-subunit dehydrogenase